MLVFGTYGKPLSQENDGPVSECSRHEEQQGKANAFSSKVKIGLPNSKHNGIVFQRYVQAVCLLVKFRSWHAEGHRDAQLPSTGVFSEEDFHIHSCPSSGIKGLYFNWII